MDERDVERALTEAAPLMGAQRLTRLAEDRWLVIDELGDEVDIVLDGVMPRLALTVEVAPLPSAGRLRACEMLLAGNLTLPAQDGPRAALDPERGMVMLSLFLPLPGLADRTLAGALTGILKAARSTAEALDALGVADKASFEAAAQGMIRA